MTFNEKLQQILEAIFEENHITKFKRYGDYLKQRGKNPKYDKVIDRFISQAIGGYNTKTLDWDILVDSLPPELHEFAVFGWTAYIDPMANNEPPKQAVKSKPRHDYDRTKVHDFEVQDYDWRG